MVVHSKKWCRLDDHALKIFDGDQVIMHSSVKNITRMHDHLVPITFLSASSPLHDKKYSIPRSDKITMPTVKNFVLLRLRKVVEFKKYRYID